MGKYNVHHHPNSARSNKALFLPVFCRLTISDAAKPSKLADLSSFSSISSSPDPSSPKISCIGQIKKRSSTTDYHLTTTRTSTAKSSTKLDYTKLRKLFSSKNLISPAIDTVTLSNHGSKCISKRSRSCNGSVTRPIITKKRHMISIEDPDVVRAVIAKELDPPLPVVKFRPRDHQVNMNLWKRRGIELKTLQIQQFQLSTFHNTEFINNTDVSLQPRASSSR